MAAPVRAAADGVRKTGKAGAEAAVVGATGGVGKVALALLPTTLDSPEERRKKRRNRRIIYAVVALLVVVVISFVTIVTMSIMSAIIGGSTQRPVSPGECLSIEASVGGPDAPRPTRGSGQMGYPVDPDVPETSPFGPRWGSFHDGLDFGGPIGTPIYAVADGVVKQSGPASGYGNWIIIEHDIDGEIVDSLYGHMRADGLHVQAGDKVKAGQHIADIASEGFSTGPHLHFGVYPGGWSEGGGVDPKPWLNQLRERGASTGGGDDPAGPDRAESVSHDVSSDASPRAEEGTVTAADWDKLAGCESGRKWDTNTGNGFFGGLQFTQSTWDAFDGQDFAATADKATREQQMEVANRVLKEQGWEAWPACTNNKFPELKNLKPAPEGTFVRTRDDDDQGGDFEDGLALAVDKAKDAGVTVGVSVAPTNGGDDVTAGAATTEEYSASAIKVAIAAAVERHLSQTDEVTVSSEHVVGGAGVGLSAGDYPVSRLQEVMITDSDNTATNALIDAVGGFDAVNAVIGDAGVRSGLSLSNKMMSGSTSSRLSAAGATSFLTSLWEASKSSGGFIPEESAIRVIDLMKSQKLRSKLPAHIPQGKVANKTGENTGVSHDIGYIWPENGPPVAVAVTTTFNGGDSAAVSAIADLGKHIYENYGGEADSGSSGSGAGQELPKTPAEKGSEDGLQVDSVRGMRLVAERFPEVDTIGGVRDDSLPDHPSGRAIDAMVGDTPEGKKLGDRIADYFIEHAEELNVDYIIWQQELWDGGSWSPIPSEGDRTADHYDHVHITFQGGGPPNGDTSYTGVGEQGEDTTAAAPYSPSSDQLSMELSPEQLANIKVIIAAAKESKLEPPERAASLGVMLSGYTADFINLPADDDPNKVGIFAESPFGGETREQLMNPKWAAEKFMEDLSGVAKDNPNWSTDKAVDVLLAVYPEKASLAQELERWEKISTEIVQELWEDPNAQAGSGLEVIGSDAEECAVGVVGEASLGGGGDLDLSTVPEAFREPFRVASTLCPGYPMSLVASEVYNESGFQFPIHGPPTDYGRAMGPAQFIPPTWEARGKDWNNDGKKDAQDPGDAIPSMMEMLCDDRDTIQGWIDEGIVEGNAEDLAIAAYHAGVYAIKNAGGMPATSDGLSTTANYVAKTRRNAVKYELPEGASNDKAPGDRASIKKSDDGKTFKFDGKAGTYQENIIKAAEEQLGQPYVWGGGDTTGPTTGVPHPQNPGGPGLDCSGLTQLAVYRATGGEITLGRHTSEQAATGRPIPIGEVQAGDLVHGPGHVGIVVAPGRMIHAPTFGQTVTEAPIQPGMTATRIVE